MYRDVVHGLYGLYPQMMYAKAVEIKEGIISIPGYVLPNALIERLNIKSNDGQTVVGNSLGLLNKIIAHNFRDVNMKTKISRNKSQY